MHRLLQFYADTFETLQLLRLWSEGVHIVWAYASDFFATLFKQNAISHLCGQSE